jgi:hypothetical protein
VRGQISQGRIRALPNGWRGRFIQHHWTHLELLSYFGIASILKQAKAEYAKLQ